MNYYPFHVGDYAAHTAHLEPMEDLAYRRLLDLYYLREQPLPADVQATAKLVRMRSMAADVESVLSEFFTLTDLGWTHSRCDAEIEKMQDKQAKARASGIASATARKSYAERARQAKPTDVQEKSTDVERSLGDSSTDVQLPTPTPTPLQDIQLPIGNLSPDKPPTCPHQKLIGLFEKHLPELPQPKPELWSGQRAKDLQSRWKWLLTATKKTGERYASSEAEGLDWFSRFFAHVAKSDFLSGRSGKWTACDLGWLVKSENFTKVVQGNYDNKDSHET